MAGGEVVDAGKASLVPLPLRLNDIKHHCGPHADRKTRFSPRQIDFAYDTLREKGWLTAA